VFGPHADPQRKTICGAWWRPTSGITSIPGRTSRWIETRPFPDKSSRRATARLSLCPKSADCTIAIAARPDSEKASFDPKLLLRRAWGTFARNWEILPQSEESAFQSM
jgi:hypothetical protein